MCVCVVVVGVCSQSDSAPHHSGRTVRIMETQTENTMNRRKLPRDIAAAIYMCIYIYIYHGFGSFGSHGDTVQHPVMCLCVSERTAVFRPIL